VFEILLERSVRPKTHLVQVGVVCASCLGRADLTVGGIVMIRNHRVSIRRGGRLH